MKEPSASTGRRRWFSLDDAARIRGKLANPEDPVICPLCGGSMYARVGTDADTSVWLTRCESCEHQLVLRVGADLSEPD